MRSGGFNVVAKVRLTTSYRHYWPKPLGQRADIICSRLKDAGIHKTWWPLVVDDT